MIQVSGPLVRDAEARRTSTGEALVIAQVQPGVGWPAEAHVNFGSSPEGHLRAEAFARDLRRGRLVTAQGDGCRPRFDHSYAALVLTGNVKLTPAP